MFLSKRKSSLSTALLALTLASCTTPITKEAGYDADERIVPQNGQIIVAGESVRWFQSKHTAKSNARYMAFHKAMLYTDSQNVVHFREDNGFNFKAGRGVPNYDSYAFFSETRAKSEAIPTQVLNRITKVKCYEMKRDLKYKYRCFAWVNVN